MPRLLCSEELDENLLRDVLRLVDVGEEQATEALDARALRVVELLIRGPYPHDAQPASLRGTPSLTKNACPRLTTRDPAPARSRTGVNQTPDSVVHMEQQGEKERKP